MKHFASKLLVATCVVANIAQVALWGNEVPPGAVEVDNFRWWQLLTYMWWHGGPLHLLVNLSVLWAFAPAVEERIGEPGLIGGYLICGIASAWLALDLLPAGHIVVGSSGAVFGIIAIYCVMNLRCRIKWIFWPRPIPTWVLLVLLAIIEGVVWWQELPAGAIHLAGLLEGICLGVGCLIGKKICPLK